MTSAEPDLPPTPRPWPALELSAPVPVNTVDTTATMPLPAIIDPPAPPAPPAPQPQLAPQAPPPPGQRVLRDRWLFLVAFMLALAILASTDTGRIFYDTKLGVDIDAGQFLSRLWSLWNPREWLGSLEDQYIGYAIPMAPFYLAGQLLHIPIWLIERLWLALLLAVGFTGLVKLARALEIGSETSRLLAGAIFALWPTFTILIGSTSATALPGLVVPWAVLPLVSAVRGRTTSGRAAARSGLAIAAMSGVNAVCTLAVLILPAFYILTHTRSRQRVRLSLQWGAAAAAATAWWGIPLLLQGRYAFNFLPYIEQATTTTQTMSAAAVLRGTGTWTAYFSLGGTPWLSAGWATVTSPAVILASAGVSALGLAGLARRDMPERRWLTICAGVTALVALAGYYGPLGGPWHTAVDHLLDGTLAPFRSLYKLEPVLAVTLALGCAHVIDRCWRLSLPLRRTRLTGTAATAPLLALALVGLAWPQLGGQVLQAGSFTSVPGYWYQAAAFLAAHSPRQTALIVPADPHGQFTWGETIDDPLEPLASSPWVERGLVPYGNAGSQVLLETVEQAVESGRDVPGLAAYLARAGIRYVVVRDDIAPTVSGYTPPQVVNETMALSGFRRVAAFGPEMAVALGYPNLAGITPGLAPAYPAVEIFQAADAALRPGGPVTTLPVSNTVLVNGGPDSLLQLQAQGILTSQPAVISGQQLSGPPALWAVTDGQRRADNSFGSTQDSQSYTYTADGTNPVDSALGGAGGPPRQLLPVTAAGHQTVAVIQGAASVTASSVGSWITEGPQYDPANAFDGNPATAWAEGSPTPAGQWLQITFSHRLDLPSQVLIRLLDDSPARPVPTRLQVTTAAGSVTTDTAVTGASQPLRVPPGPTRTLRITILGAARAVPGGPGAGISDVYIPGVRVTTDLQPAEDVTAGAGAAGVAFSFAQQPTLPATQPGSGLPPDLGLDRTFVVPAARSVTAQLTAVPTAGPALDALVTRLAGAGKSSFRVTATSDWDGLPEFGPASMYEPGPRLPWIAAASDRHPGLEFSWHGRRTITKLDLTAARGLAAPTKVLIRSGTASRLEVVRRGGVVRISPALRTSRISLTFPSTSSPRRPTGLATVTIPALRGLHPAVPRAAAAFHLRCGQGPTVSVGGRSYSTWVSGTVGDLVQLLPVRLNLCTHGDRLTLTAGRQWLSTGSSPAFVVTGASLTSAPTAAAGPAPARELRILSWGSDNRALRIGPGAAAYVEVHEGFDAGWAASLGGRPLKPATLDGWQQAFIVPAGQGGTITLTFQPATIYHAGIIASALALLALLGCALGAWLWRPRRRVRRRASAPQPGPGDATAPQPGHPGPGDATAPQPGRDPGPDGTTAPQPGRDPGPAHIPAGQGSAPVLIFRAGHWLPAGPAAAPAPPGPGNALALKPAGGLGPARRAWLAVRARPAGDARPSRAVRLARATVALLPLTIVIAVAGGPVAIAVPVLALVGWWRPRWLPAIAAGAMVTVGLFVALSSHPTVMGSGPFSGGAQLLALVALTAALMPAIARSGRADTRPADTTPEGN
jgi:arabinofuranan 3-O-arabinosyltransferase